jgi:trigger factor
MDGDPRSPNAAQRARVPMRSGDREVRTDVKSIEQNEVLLTVEIPSDVVKTSYERTLSRLARETQVPGFRKGRVPRQIVLQRLGEEYVRSQTLNDALPDWYESALTESHVDAVSVPEIDFEAFDQEAEFSFTAKVQVRPTPVLGEYLGVQAPRRSAEVSDAQVEAQLAMLQERLASLAPVEGRPVAPDDFVLLDLEGSSDGKPIEGAKASDYMTQVGHGRLVPGFEENLEGMAVGESKEFSLTFPEDYQAEELRGKDAVFKVHLKEIKTKVVPELDDAFAADASEFETIAELRADVRKRLEQAQEAAARREFAAGVVDAVVANATVAVPPAMVEREAHELLHDLESTIGEQGLTMDAYLAALQKTAEEVEQEMRPRAEHIVKRRLVLEAVSEAEQLAVSDDELRERIKADAQALGREPEQLVIDVWASGRQDLMRAELLMAKTVDFLVEHAAAVEADDEPTEAGAADAEGAAVDMEA